MRKCFIPKKGLEIMYLEKGLGREEIGKRLGVHKDTVRYWLKKHDIPIRKSGRPKKFNVPKEELERLYITNQQSIEKISKAFNVSYFTVLKRIKEYELLKKK